MKNQIRLTAWMIIIVMAYSVTGCKERIAEKSQVKKPLKPERSDTGSQEINLIVEMPKVSKMPVGMVWIPGGTFKQGAVPHDKMALQHEKPGHSVAVDGFFMDITEVTNVQFARFVEETGYITVAEREIDWEEMKKQLPEGTPRPHDSILKPGSLTFKKTAEPVPNFYDFSQWWKWTIGANWKHPKGPGSSIEGKENYPVVHIAYEDALAYCEWAGRRLPTEAEWELAARGKNRSTIYFWGDDISIMDKKANTWEGNFPVENLINDGFEGSAPVKMYGPNSLGLYDMAGNVWEWTSDWYNSKYYERQYKDSQTRVNPKGAENPFNQQNPYAKEKIMKGGSFLCNASYCASYRVSARMATSMDSSLEHLGFRTVVTPSMIKEGQIKP